MLRNQNLKNQLSKWVTQLDEECLIHPINSAERRKALTQFCSTFVPLDVAQVP